ncbi:unnamed protein product [Protopolystoma xenopodis]|uniref:Uncharacterized protein n=1 Tax=Protopolystoma xenopodis TaxID=117903 RepID=A0A3S5CEE2_9PLAT|nr:unnamed protein product [Protopolystoma xenopodis]
MPGGPGAPRVVMGARQHIELAQRRATAAATALSAGSLESGTSQGAALRFRSFTQSVLSGSGRLDSVNQIWLYVLTFHHCYHLKFIIH